MLVLHALGHAPVISRSLTWEILWALILRFARPSSFAGRGAPGHHQPTARRRPAHDGYGCLTLADNAAPALEIPQAPAVAHQPGQRRRTFWEFPRGYRCTGKRSPITARRAGGPLIYTAPGTRPSPGATD